MNDETGGQKLDAWRASQGIKKGWLADKIGVNDSTLTRWVLGDVIPQRTARLAIELVTGGAVPASAWEVRKKFTPEYHRKKTDQDVIDFIGASSSATIGKRSDGSMWVSIEAVGGVHFQCNYLGSFDVGPVGVNDFSEMPPLWVMKKMVSDAWECDQ